jgi:multidrug efflux pump subunit AcrA (membrane-fusion protein)
MAHQRPIEIGERRYGVVEVLSGLDEGELVVTEGTIKLRDRTPVRLIETEPELSSIPVAGPTDGRTSTRI